MTDPNETSDDEKLARRSRQLFEHSVATLDASTRSKLTRARQAALDELNPQRSRRRWLWMPLAGTAAAALVAAVMLRAPERAVEPAGTVLEDLEIVSDQDSLELLEDVEFYAWMSDVAARNSG